MIEAGAHLAVHYHSSAAPAQALVARARANGLRACAIGADLTNQADGFISGATLDINGGVYAC